MGRSPEGTAYEGPVMILAVARPMKHDDATRLTATLAGVLARSGGIGPFDGRRRRLHHVAGMARLAGPSGHWRPVPAPGAHRPGHGPNGHRPDLLAPGQTLRHPHEPGGDSH